MLRLKQIIIWQLILIFMLTLSYGEATTPEEFEEIRDKVTVSRPYTLDTEVELAVLKDKAIKLDISDNPDGFKECIVYWESSGPFGSCIHMFFFDTNGNLLNRGGSPLPRIKGALRQVGRLPYLTIATWNLEDDKIIIQFCISSDKDRIQREYEKLEAREIRMSLQIKDHSKILPPIKLTEAERLAGFVKLWSEIKYNFAFFDQVPEIDWDEVLEEYLPKVQQAESTEQYYRLLKQCVALLKDGHTSVDGPSGEPMFRPPVEIRSLQGKAVIVEITPADKIKNPKQRQALLKADLKLGEEITYIDGRPIKEILEQDIYPYIFASTGQWRDLKAYPKLLNGEDGTEVKLHIKGLDGAERDVTLIRGTYSYTLRGRGFSFRKLADDIAYVNLHSFGSEEIAKQFDEVFEKIQGAKGLIIDVRENGGGNSSNGDAIISYLIKKAIPHTLWKTPQHIAAFKAWGRPKKWFEGERRMIEPRQGENYPGPLVILIGPETFSAAEDFVVPLHAAGRATIVGQKSGGSTGQPLRFSLLDGKISGRVCTKRDQYPDGREFVGVGIIPDVEVHPTPADIAADRDVVLEKGLEVLRAKIK